MHCNHMSATLSSQFQYIWTRRDSRLLRQRDKTQDCSSESRAHLQTTVFMLRFDQKVKYITQRMFDISETSKTNGLKQCLQKGLIGL